MTPRAARRAPLPHRGYRIQKGDTLLIVGEEDKVNEFVEDVGD